MEGAEGRVDFPAVAFRFLQKSERDFYKIRSSLFWNHSDAQSIPAMRMKTNQGSLENISGIYLPFYGRLRCREFTLPPLFPAFYALAKRILLREVAESSGGA